MKADTDRLKDLDQFLLSNFQSQPEFVQHFSLDFERPPNTASRPSTRLHHVDSSPLLFIVSVEKVNTIFFKGTNTHNPKETDRQ